MKNYLAFFRKELLEYTRTYKLFIMLIIFSILGITNPLMAKLLPELLNSMLTQGMPITLAEPTALDT